MLKIKNIILFVIIYLFFKFFEYIIRVIGVMYFLKGWDVYFLVFYIEKKIFF